MGFGRGAQYRKASRLSSGIHGPAPRLIDSAVGTPPRGNADTYSANSVGEPQGANDDGEMCIAKLAGHRGSSDSHSAIEGVGGQPIYSMIQTSAFTYDESVE